MTDRPILFSPEMVRAIEDGRKTQTRRVLKPQPPESMRMRGIYAPGLTAVFECELAIYTRGDFTVRLPYMPGDRLWVRERHVIVGPGDIGYGLTVDKPIARYYSVDNVPGEKYFPDGGWRPSIFMPRWASRLTLVVTGIRVERIADISWQDAVAEGVDMTCRPESVRVEAYAPTRFFALWDSLNERRGFGVVANPWIVAVTFEAHHCNIDRMEDR